MSFKHKAYEVISQHITSSIFAHKLSYPLFQNNSKTAKEGPNAVVLEILGLQSSHDFFSSTEGTFMIFPY
jgi:hypothetical protein